VRPLVPLAPWVPAQVSALLPIQVRLLVLVQVKLQVRLLWLVC
jgi:hypothetical protein